MVFIVSVKIYDQMRAHIKEKNCRKNPSDFVIIASTFQVNRK